MMSKGCAGKPKVAFVCVHNSCRSQIAEALGKKLASDVFESYSAGTELKDHINPDAVSMMKKLHVFIGISPLNHGIKNRLKGFPQIT